MLEKMEYGEGAKTPSLRNNKKPEKDFSIRKI